MSSGADQLRVQESSLWVRAQVMPYVLFMGFLLLSQFGGELIEWNHPAAPWWRRWPNQWIYPLQTVVCLGYLIRHWRFYEFHWNLKWSLIAVVFGAVGIGLWLLPTTLYDHWKLEGETTGLMKWFGVAERKDGFNPHELEHPAAYFFSLVMRFLRAAVVVAMVEEIFWRSFLSRFVHKMDGSYWKLAFGVHSTKIMLVTTLAFTFAHAPVDYAGAICYGLLTYLLYVRSKNLGACVIMHATANFLMGCYIMAYGKYGLW